VFILAFENIQTYIAKKLMRIVNLIVMLTIMLIVNSCSYTHLLSSNISTWFPPDFNPKTDWLVIDTDGIEGKQVKKMINFAEKKYPYKYSFVSGTLLTEQTADPKIYRFVLMNSLEWSPYTKGPAAVIDFHFFDRLKKLKYARTNWPSPNASDTFEGLISTMLEKYP
jgi:hypothetical protein